MKFVIYAKDKAGSLELRQANRAAHLEYAQNSGIVTFAKPLLSDAGEMIGSLVMLEVTSHMEAESFIAEDPYNLAGLFDTIELTRIAE